MAGLNVTSRDDVNVAELSGDIDSKTAPEVQEQLLLLVEQAKPLVIDLGRVAYMSSAGLRMMLLVYRQAATRKGKIVLAAVPAAIKDVMSMTGFLKFFILCDGVQEALKTAGQR